MTVTISVYDNGKQTFNHMALGKSMSLVDDYLKENNIQHEVGKEYDDVVEYSKEQQVQIIHIDNTNVMGVDGNLANFVSEYWVEYNELVLQNLIKALEK